ncbi:hypothetical protein VRC12_09325 [Pseudomonas poae]|uniref:hypothetical protein n=1 Tax=Pseudomonas poae TaxID=200451 RepID=UPI003D9AB750
MSKWLGVTLFVCVMTGLYGCAGRAAERFTLEVDLPAEFKIKTAANYRPARGETCTLPRRRGKRPERKVFFSEYASVASRVSYELPLTETADGCPLVLSDVEFDIYAKWGARYSDVAGDITSIFIGDGATQNASSEMGSGVQVLRRQCQWLFRTAGPQHAIIKVLKCKSVTDEEDERRKSVAVERDQLVKKTLRVVIGVIGEERPYMGDNWVQFPQGWKRCRGKSLEDQSAFCAGNTVDFKSFKMPDGRRCIIYPTCTE